LIKTLVVSGCSFTNDYQFKTWPRHLPEVDKNIRLLDVSFPGAGNNYIAESIIQTILYENLDPTETLVLTMWSGISRKDVLVSKDYYNLIDESSKTKLYDQNFAFSGGQIGLWTTSGNSFLKSLFENWYKSTDHSTMGFESLSSMIRLQSFLEARNFPYKFMSYVNYWQDIPDYIGRNGDFSLSYYNRDNPYLSLLDKNWIWADHDKNCLFEYARDRGLLDVDQFHPIEAAHKPFANDIILPAVEEYFR
jgi:hypothetical protein